MVDALEVSVTAPVVSFRNPLYAGVQVALPCPPPSTVGGMLAATAGGWPRVDPGLRFAMAFHAGGRDNVDLETYHPLEATGKATDPAPRDREFLADVTLTVWLLTDVELWERRFRRPVWPLRLGRSQDLAAARTCRIQVDPGSGRQGQAVVPRDATEAGTLLQLPTAVSEDRARTRWDAYRYHADGHDGPVTEHADGYVDPHGRAVVPLPPTHPIQFTAEVSR